MEIRKILLKWIYIRLINFLKRFMKVKVLIISKNYQFFILILINK